MFRARCSCTIPSRSIPTLAKWINDLLHDLLGWGPWTFIVVLGIAIVLIPIWLIYNAAKHPAIDNTLDDED